VWTNALKSCADPPRARHFFELLAGAGVIVEKFPAEKARVLAALFSGSEAMGTLLAAHPEWLPVLEPDSLAYPRRKQGFAREVAGAILPVLDAGDEATALGRLRAFKQREMLRIAARDLARLGGVAEITLELSDLADVCLDTIWRICHRRLAEKYGRPFHQDADGRWQPSSGCLVGLGKLGGQELNYSSDVDLIVVYDEEGSVFKETPAAGRAPRALLTNHQFFNRLAEGLIAEVTRMTPEGSLYRVDFRLRPEGETGPLSRSLSSYETYYAQWGQTWERMMLIKARGVAGVAATAASFLEMVHPFCYPRSVAPDVLHEVAAMKDRIENEVVRAGELERNVKLGRGGIREIEFIAQSLQLLHAGAQPFLQRPRTLEALEKLAQYEWLTAAECRSLAQAYCFLREVEHRLQMEGNAQTHTIPANRAVRQRLARLMGLKTAREFEARRRAHTGEVRRVFNKLLKAGPGEAAVVVRTPFPRRFDGAEAEWLRFLAAHGFRDAGRALRVVREFVEGPGYVHSSARTIELGWKLLPRLFAVCPAGLRPARGIHAKPKTLSDPDRVVMRLDSFVSTYGARATLYELWNNHPTIFELLVQLFDRSEFLAEMAIRTPDLVDELVTSGRLRQRKSAADTLRDLRHGIGDADQHAWMRRYHQAELMRIGLRDILGLADFEQYLTELSCLADACLQYALEVAMRRRRITAMPFAIIGLGKLGGAEIDYGSDLDILFVTEGKARELSRVLPLAVEVMDLLSRRTEQGTVFQTDARLRPDGEKGLLVATVRGCEEYYRQRAQLWEIQTLTRARHVAGDPLTGGQFQKLAARLTNFAKPDLPLAAFTPGWKDAMRDMRHRIETGRTPPGQEELAIKTGCGGLMDAEFIAQALCLEYGWQEPNTLRALERGLRAKVLPGAAKLITSYRALRRVEGILRRWSYAGESVLPDEAAAFLRVSVRCGLATAGAFRKSIATWRAGIREGFERVFGKFSAF
jgi:glutamate-ammonia-ligase adenylyltransferase